MATVPTQIRIDEDVKREATELLEGLGLNLSDAMNIFLRQIILVGGLPFSVTYPNYKPEVVMAMVEAKKISCDNNVKSYTDVNEMFREILADDTES